jgi:hypothetical protein
MVQATLQLSNTLFLLTKTLLLLMMQSLQLLILFSQLLALDLLVLQPHCQTLHKV